MSLRGLAVVVTDFFFDELDVENPDRLPDDRPVILAANHHSGLMDAMLLYATSPREVRAVAKSTLWKIWPLKPFLAAGRVIPVYRHRDGGGDNTNAFAAISEALGAGEVIGIFVEGTSHDNPGLVEVKTGAARMALDARATGAAPIIVPVGLVFEDRERFRSDALVRFGEPIDVVELFPATAADDRSAVRELTDLIAEGLGVVAPAWESEAQRAAARTAAMKALPVGASLGEVEAEAERLAMLGEVADPDTRLVGQHGQADLLVPPSDVDRAAAAVLWPFAKVGQLTNLPPYVATSLVTAGRDRNIRATIKSIAAIILFPIWWAAVAVASHWVGLSWIWAIGVAGLVAVLGVVAARERPLARDERRTLQHVRDVGA